MAKELKLKGSIARSSNFAYLAILVFAISFDSQCRCHPEEPKRLKDQPMQHGTRVSVGCHWRFASAVFPVRVAPRAGGSIGNLEMANCPVISMDMLSSITWCNEQGGVRPPERDAHWLRHPTCIKECKLETADRPSTTARLRHWRNASGTRRIGRPMIGKRNRTPGLHKRSQGSRVVCPGL